MLPRRELSAVAVLAAILGLRMFGLFAALPVVAIHARRLSDSDAAILAGVAVGAYGLTQAILQIPFGRLADRIGRRRAIFLGLAIFAVGSVIAAAADNVWELIFGRLAQGAGVVFPAVAAAVADATDPSHRSRAMAVLGIAVGASFALAIIIATPLAAAVGISGVFIVAAAAAIAAMIPLIFLSDSHHSAAAAIPSNSPADNSADGIFSRRRRTVNLGGFVLHYAMAAVFVLAPLSLAKAMPLAAHWKIYLAAFAASLLLAAPMIFLADRRKSGGRILSVAGFFLAAAAIAIGFSEADSFAIGAGLFLFFCGFNTLEAALPARASRLAPANSRGAAMGGYAACQFIGAFFGGAITGILSAKFGAMAAAIFLLLVIVLWIAVSFRSHISEEI